MNIDFKNYFSLLVVEATREDIKKFYPQIDVRDFSAILDSDPTRTKDKVGNLSRLVLDLYKKDKFELEKETLFDIYTAFDTIQKKKASLVGTEFEKYRNLNMIVNVKTLMSIKYYLDQKVSNKIKLKAGEGQDVNIFYEDENWVIKVPLDYKASVRLGRDCKGEWCVSSSSAMTHYNRYIAKDDVYFFINKSTNESYLYFDHGNKIEFNNIENRSANLDRIVRVNHLEKALSKIKTESKKIQTDKSYYEKRLLERYKQTKSPYIILTILDGQNSDDLIEKLFSIHKPNLDEELLISDNGQNRPNSKKYTTLNLGLYLEGSKHSTIVYNEKFIKALCERFHIENYTINEDLSVNADRVYFHKIKFKRIPIKFNEINQSFSVEEGSLVTLENAPRDVGFSFSCYDNHLKSLEGGPEFVGGDFECHYNYLENLVGAPKTIDGSFNCCDNQLTSLKGCTQIIPENFNCSDNQLTSLEGGPEEVTNNFVCRGNNLTSLKGAPKTVYGSFYCEDNAKEFTEEEVRAVCDVRGRVVT